MRNVIRVIVLLFLILLSTIYVGESLIAPQGATVMAATATYHFTITGCPTSVTAGQSFSDITVTVYYASGQVWTNYTGKVYFTSSDPKATLPYVSTSTYTFTTGSSGDNGVHTFSGFNLVTAGSQNITVTDGSMSATSSQITVTPSTPVQLQISPKTATITAGSKQTYTATADDSFGNSWDVSSSTQWFVSYGSGGTWSGSTFTSAKAGTFTVTAVYTAIYEGTYEGTFVAQASLTVNPSTAISITLSPKTPSVSAGNSVTFTATAQDSFGNIWDVTNLTNWQIDANAGGSWSNNVYTSAKVGTWIVTGTYLGYSDTASLTVTHSTPSYLTITPTNPTFAAGSQVTFTATASDFYGNTWDVTGSTSWSITSAAGGAWSGNVYSCVKAGIWTVTGNYSGIIGTTTLTVSYANVYSVTISSHNTSISAGSSISFTATASDIYGNTWDVTNSTSWSTSAGAGGSWSGNVYTSAMAGVWAITASLGNTSGTAQLNVMHASASNIAISPQNSSITAGQSQLFNATAYDPYGNSWDVTTSTAWNIDPQAGGNWTGNTYTAAKAGTGQSQAF